MSSQSLEFPLSQKEISLPLLPLRDMVAFPQLVVPLFVGREKSIKALEKAMSEEKTIILVAQKSANQDDLTQQDIYEVGCIGSILQMLKLPDGTIKVLVEGRQRARIVSMQNNDGYIDVVAQPLQLKKLTSAQQVKHSTELSALKRTLLEQFNQYLQLNKKIPTEIGTSITNIEDIDRLVDTIAAHLPIKIENKQELLATQDLKERMLKMLVNLESEMDILSIDQKIRTQVKKQMEKNQRDFYLNEQVKAIQKELNNGEDDNELKELEKKIEAAHMSQEAQDKALGELKKLKLMSPMSAEATVVRSYLDVLIDLPWNKKSSIKRDLPFAQTVLDEDHYGLERVKERVLEYLAVQLRVEKIKAPILCLVGPPGVGKTSLGQSIAKATGREYVRMALGGVHDEAEIRGHRRTYIGAMPGKVLQNLTKIGVKNPLFLLDEIDKMGSDFRGDPASALLEVLDPEQNHTFADHYAEVDFDLSDVMFVATSNSLNIPPALLDRMEVIRLEGYTEDEKISIAKRYLVPKQMLANGLKPNELNVSDSVLQSIVRFYTKEAGVRSLEREISKICRKVVKQQTLTAVSETSSKSTKTKKTAKDSKKSVASVTTVTDDNLHHYLGVRKFQYGRAKQQNRIGQVVGLAWTEVGGDLLTIESAIMPGKGNITRTGSLGEVMKESIEAARTVIRSRTNSLGIGSDIFEKNDLHIHVPDGATPKDGPSAGAAVATALASALTGIAVHANVAMTGEITLRGEITAIGGLKEKLLAALRGGIKKVLIPQENIKDLEDIPQNVKDHLAIIPVQWFDEVLKHALEKLPTPLAKKGDLGAGSTQKSKRNPRPVSKTKLIAPTNGGSRQVKH